MTKHLEFSAELTLFSSTKAMMRVGFAILITIIPYIIRQALNQFRLYGRT